MKPKSVGWKNGVKWVQLWHVSPTRLSCLKARSTFWGASGLYVSPSYGSLIHDWCSVVLNRKGGKHPFKALYDTAYNRYWALHDREAAGELLTPDELLEKARWSEIRDRAAVREFPEERYSKIYIHELHCPLAVYEEAQEHYHTTLDAKFREEHFGFWFWGLQVFLKNSRLPEVAIHKTTQMSYGDYLDEYANYQRSAYYRDFHFMKQEIKRWR